MRTEEKPWWSLNTKYTSSDQEGRSQERETKEEEMQAQDLDAALTATLSSEIDRKIHDIAEDIRDLKDQMKASQHQLACCMLLVRGLENRSRGQKNRSRASKNRCRG